MRKFSRTVHCVNSSQLLFPFLSNWSYGLDPYSGMTAGENISYLYTQPLPCNFKEPSSILSSCGCYCIVDLIFLSPCKTDIDCVCQQTILCHNKFSCSFLLLQSELFGSMTLGLKDCAHISWETQKYGEKCIIMDGSQNVLLSVNKVQPAVLSDLL